MNTAVTGWLNWKTAMKQEVTLVVFCFVSWMLVQPAHAGDTVTSFDDLPPNTVVTNQYASAGVVFASGPGCGVQLWRSIMQLPAGVAQSGTQVLNITAVAEVSQTGVCGQFAITRQHVSVFIGDWGTTTHPVTLAAYDAGGVEIGRKTVTITGEAGIHTQLSVSSPSQNISSFSIFIPGPQDTFARVAIDDLSFDAPTGANPDFGLSSVSGLGVAVDPVMSSPKTGSA